MFFSLNLKDVRFNACFTDFSLTGNVFITYSVDTAKDIILFTKFLTDQGFKPAVSPMMSPIIFAPQ